MSGFAAIHRLSKIKLKPFTGITYYNSMEGKSKIPISIQVGMNDLGGLHASYQNCLNLDIDN